MNGTTYWGVEATGQNGTGLVLAVGGLIGVTDNTTAATLYESREQAEALLKRVEALRPEAAPFGPVTARRVVEVPAHEARYI